MLLERGIPLLPFLVVIVWCWLSWEARRYRRQAVSPPPSPPRSAGLAAWADDLAPEPWPHEELRHIHRQEPVA
jgi:hypothetical protein